MERFGKLCWGACLVVFAAATGDDTCAWDADEEHTFELTYFDGRGLAEVSRTLFASAGRLPGCGFKDNRLSRDEFVDMKEKGELTQNLNRLPVLHHNGVVIGESSAINRYLAKTFGFFGSNDAEAAQIDAICEHLVDIKAAYRKLVPYGKDMSDEEKNAAKTKWFDTPSSPSLDNRGERQLQWFLEQLEGMVGGDGYMFGGKTSLADAYMFNMLGEHAPEVEGDGGEPFGSVSGTGRVLEKLPKLTAVIEKFKAGAGMTQYLAAREPQAW